MGRGQLLFLLAGMVIIDLLAKSESTNSDKLLEKYTKQLEDLTRQVMMQQLSTEESVRASGDSGFKQTRSFRIGTRPYYTATHSAFNGLNCIHDHGEHETTIGMGEVVVVMNGVEFRTRHNDYTVYKPHSTSKGYRETEKVEFPPVPPEVLAKKDVSEQVKEMIEWFKAWKEQDYSTRDYRKYFKPLMCYLEGAWTLADHDDVQEPFPSDRHHVSAKTWWELERKISFTAYTGTKDNKENYAFLPKKIMYLNDTTGEPVWAQWNYRILCANVTDIPTSWLRPIDELAPRVQLGWEKRNYTEYLATRKARFYLDRPDRTGTEDKTGQLRSTLDEIMEQIPGMDNYMGNLKDDAFGSTAKSGSSHATENEDLNTAYYHRYYKSGDKSPYIMEHRVRGFADSQLYMAQTSHKEIPCLKEPGCTTPGTCCSQRWTYAIPMEIIYMTPLENWNPYNIVYHPYAGAQWKIVTKGGRNGKNKPYNGNTFNTYYHTPKDLFQKSTSAEEADPADTDKGVVGVLDGNGNRHQVMASGIRTLLPEIPGVGVLRQRYPIPPIHGEGGTAGKELEAFKDAVLHKLKYPDVYDKFSLLSTSWDVNTKKVFRMAPNVSPKTGTHTHQMSIDVSDVLAMKKYGSTYQVTTDMANNHTHNLVIAYNPTAEHKWVVQQCDESTAGCWDNHPLFLTPANFWPKTCKGGPDCWKNDA